MIRWLLIVTTLIYSESSFAATSAQCLGKAIWMEARGEPIATQKAVWQTIRNRSRISGKGVCQVVKEKGQFSWARHVKSWKLTQEQLTMLFEVVNMEPVVNQRVVYFNSRRHRFGRRTRKIGNLFFSE